MKPDCLLLKPLPQKAREALGHAFNVHEMWLADDPAVLVSRLGGQCRFVVASGGAPCKADLLDQLPGLEIVGNFGVGYDSVDTAACAKRGIVVTNTPDVLNDEVADTTIALLLGAIRRMPQADAFVRAGKWPDGNFPLTGTLIGKKIGILGFGRIGQTIAKRLSGFNIASISYHARSAKTGLPFRYYERLTDMAADSDVLIVITPGGAATHHLVNREVLEALGPRGCLVNVARGPVVDETALIDCLRTGKLGCAGLDVFEFEPQVPAALMALDNVALAPHVGSGTTYTRDAMGMLVVDNLVSWKEGKGPLTPVPETPVPPRSGR